MQEDFLHYVWKLKKFDVLKIMTTDHEKINLTSVGTHNLNSGPDFFNSKLRIDNQLWAGNVEIHVKSSDWFLHNHETDKAYDNVILHVVWEHDTDVFRRDNSKIPTLVLKDVVSENVVLRYKGLLNNLEKWINCETDFKSVDDFVINNWLERLYIERLEEMAKTIESLLTQSINEWEAVMFHMLAKNFGLKVNGEAFYSLASSVDFSILRKVFQNLNQMEALLYGQANMLNDAVEDPYYLQLQKEYAFLKQKFKLDNQGVLPIQYFRLRPTNFPTIRISQLANVYHLHHDLFSKIIDIKSLKEFYKLFSTGTSEFWESHYTFDKVSKPSKKTISKSFVDLLLINTIIPLQYCYAKYKGQHNHEDVLKLIQELKPETNMVVDKFQSLKPVSNSALQSQGLLQLKNGYCDKNKCLQCAIGNTLLKL
jgi:hypothetical protein